MKREIFFELVSSFDSSVVERRSKVMQFPYIARRAGLPLTCTEQIRDFAAPPLILAIFVQNMRRT